MRDGNEKHKDNNKKQKAKASSRNANFKMKFMARSSCIIKLSSALRALKNVIKIHQTSSPATAIATTSFSSFSLCSCLGARTNPQIHYEVSPLNKRNEWMNGMKKKWLT